MMLALYISFWLQLEGASTSATCVSILAMQARGQVLQKSFYRMLGTVIGVVAALVIAGAFNEMRTLFLVSSALWLATCVTLAGLCDGFRAYGCVLSGYTVAIVGMPNIDMPLQTFTSGVDRGAAIAVGIVATALVNEIVTIPHVLDGFLARVDAAHAEVRAFVTDGLDRGIVEPVDVAGLYSKVTVLRTEAVLLTADSALGQARYAAARRILSALVREVRAACVLVEVLDTPQCDRGRWRDGIMRAFAGQRGPLNDFADLIESGASTQAEIVLARSAYAVIAHDRVASEARRNVESGIGSVSAPRLPVYHSVPAALRNGLRAFLAFLSASAFFIVTGWPATSYAMSAVGALVGLSATQPDSKVFSIGTNVGMIVIAAVVGITEFGVLEGASDFPMLALVMLPTVLVSCFMLSSGKPLLLSTGFIMLVYLPVLLDPSNPQVYDAQIWLQNSFLSIAAATVLGIVLAILLPTSDEQRRRWMLSSLRRNLNDVALGSRAELSDEAEAAYLAADRIAQLASLHYDSDADRSATLKHALRIAALTSSMRWVRSASTGLRECDESEARACLATFDPVGLRTLARTLAERPNDGSDRARVLVRWASANMARTAALIESHADDIALVRLGANP